MQSIVRSKKLDKMTKRIGLSMRHFVFRQRLKYKCAAQQIEYVEVDERCTSKTCSICGEYKKDLGSNEIYDCDKCKNKVDRDMGGARCIAFKNTR